jgi:hypothetical protein
MRTSNFYNDVARHLRAEEVTDEARQAVAEHVDERLDDRWEHDPEERSEWLLDRLACLTLDEWSAVFKALDEGDLAEAGRTLKAHDRLARGDFKRHYYERTEAVEMDAMRLAGAL